MDGLKVTLSALPDSGLIVVAYPAAFTPEQLSTMGKGIKRAKALAGSSAVFIFVPDNVRLESIQDDQLKAIGLQRIKGEG